jgi:8-hydroxy-5-deazaflavin:NADPH oxidoreductase
MTDRIAVVGGSGALGRGLAVWWAGAGLDVIVGSRDESRAHDVAEKLSDLSGRPIEGRSNEDAVIGSQFVVLAVPLVSHAATLTGLRDHLAPGQILVDTTVPLAAAIGGRATRPIMLHQGSAAQQAAELVPDGVEVVGGFHTVAAATLADYGEAIEEDVLLVGNSRDAKRRVAQLVRAIPGLRPVDAGRLDMARIVECLTPLLIGINIRNKVHAGIRITAIPDAEW